MVDEEMTVRLSSRAREQLDALAFPEPRSVEPRVAAHLAAYRDFERDLMAKFGNLVRDGRLRMEWPASTVTVSDPVADGAVWSAKITQEPPQFYLDGEELGRRD